MKKTTQLFRIPQCYRDAYDTWFVQAWIDVLPKTCAAIQVTWNLMVEIADALDISMVPVWAPGVVVFALFRGDDMVAALRLPRQPKLEPFVFLPKTPHTGLPPGFHVDIT